MLPIPTTALIMHRPNVVIQRALHGRTIRELDVLLGVVRPFGIDGCVFFHKTGVFPRQSLGGNKKITYMKKETHRGYFVCEEKP